MFAPWKNGVFTARASLCQLKVSSCRQLKRILAVRSSPTWLCIHSCLHLDMTLEYSQQRAGMCACTLQTCQHGYMWRQSFLKKKNSGSFAKASLRIPLQQFVFFFFLQRACTMHIILHGSYIQADVDCLITIAEGTDVVFWFFLLSLLPKCRFPVSIRCITQYFQVGFWRSSAIFPAYLSRMRDLLSSIHNIVFQPHTNSHILSRLRES